MVHLEDWMNIQELHQLGLSQCQIAERLDLDRKTVRKYLHGPPQGYPTRAFRSSKLIPITTILPSRWNKEGTTRTNWFLKIKNADIQEANSRFVTFSRVGEPKNRNEPSCALRRRPASKASSTGRTSATF